MKAKSKTTQFKSRETAAEERKWFVVDATDKVVGRVAAQIANVLRGKRNPAYAPHTDTGDFVIVINAEKIKFSGEKLQSKLYRHHSGYPGGLKAETAGKRQQRKPEDLIKLAVSGMLPKTPLGRTQLLKLKVYRGEKHPHQAQTPVELSI
ncbi:MAG: 50S ribosomal protein L13 [Deltaproteobacteria bacterium]|nr:50S ribosomal protein L13 [Deltaproteobacteria bacterium]